MFWNGQDRKTVFILGAGATRGALSHVTLNRKRLRPPLNSDFFDIAETFVRAQVNNDAFRRRYDRVRRVFQDEFPTRGRWPIGMEEAFSLLYVSKDFPEIYATRRGRRREAGSRIEIEDFLRLTYGILAAIETHARSATLYDDLAQHLGPHDCIVTLNYDTLLDSALVRRGWDPSVGYAITGGIRKVKWRMRRPATSPDLKHVRLIKLHGSMNWYARGSFDTISTIFQKKPSLVVITDRPRINEPRRLIRQIVPPLYGKFFGHNHWQVLWDTAHRALLDAEVAVVIGCSLLDTDFHLRGMIGHAISVRKRKRNRFRRAVIVNGTKTRRKWLRLMRGSFNVQEEYPTFATFAGRHLR
jgi:hypothetical protein